MSDIRIAFYHKQDHDTREINEVYTFHRNLTNWCSDPAIIEEKIFCEDLNSSLNYAEGMHIGIPHFASFIDSLYVRKVLNYSSYKFINNAFYDFDDDILNHADVIIISADVMVFLTDDQVEKMLSSPAKIMIDATFEAFTFQYYYPVMKLFTEKYKPKKEITMVVGSNRINSNTNVNDAYKNYTGVTLEYFDYFRINETLVGSSGLNNHSHDDPHMSNCVSEELIIENFNSKKTKDFLCLNNRPRFHRMALIERFRDLGLLDNNYISRRWQWPAKKHVVQPLLYELIIAQSHSPRLLDELRIYNETPDSLVNKLRKYPEQMVIPEYSENVEVKSDKDNATDLLDDRSFSNEVYKNSIYTIAVETYFEPSFIDGYPKVNVSMLYEQNRAFLTEKVYKPIQFGHMFIPFAMKGTMKTLENLGFKNFHEEFNCDDTYDSHPDNTIRYNTFIDIIKNFDSSRITDNTLEKILHNYRLFYNKSHVMKSIDDFYTKFLGRK